MVQQGTMKPDEATKMLAIFEGKFTRLKEERDNIARAKEALELAEPGMSSESISLHSLDHQVPMYIKPRSMW